MSNVIAMPTREDWARIEATNHELAVKVINLLQERDALVTVLGAILEIDHHGFAIASMPSILRQAALAALNAVSSPGESS